MSVIALVRLQRIIGRSQEFNFSFSVVHSLLTQVHFHDHVSISQSTCSHSVQSFTIFHLHDSSDTPEDGIPDICLPPSCYHTKPMDRE